MLNKSAVNQDLISQKKPPKTSPTISGGGSIRLAAGGGAQIVATVSREPKIRGHRGGSQN